MLTVTPQIIDPTGTADVSHTSAKPKTVTITNQNGVSVTLQVPSGQTVSWAPPAGWTSAKFNTPGCDEVFRYISAGAEGQA